MTSSVLKIEDLLSSYITGASAAPSFTKFMQALLKGNHELFRRTDQHEVFPLFSCDPHLAQSPLLFVRVLSLLNASFSTNKGIDEQHLTVQSIQEYFDAIGCAEAAIDRCLIALMEAKLVEPYDMSNRTVAGNQRLAITACGRIHLELAMANSVFFEQMALTTPISNPETAEQICGTYRSKSPYRDRMDRVRSLFLKHLISEDQRYVEQTIEKDQYSNQFELIENLKRFDLVGNDQRSAATRDTSGETQLPSVVLVQSGVLATIEWYNSEKGFGFAEVDGLEEQAFVHAEQLRLNDITVVFEGDIILCDISKNQKGLFVSNIFEVEENREGLEIVDCEIVKLFKDRDYGFVAIIGGSREAYFRYSIFERDDLDKLHLGMKLRAEVFPDPRGRGMQVKKVIPC